MSAHEKAVEAATRAYLYELDLDPDMPHGLEPDAEIWRKVQAPMISAAITAYLASMQEQGWVMVPREATDNMVDAARHFLEPQTERIGRSCYRAMIEAAKGE